MALKREKVREHHVHTCIVCDREFVFEHFNEKFCSKDCRRKFRNVSNGRSSEDYKRERIIASVFKGRNKQVFSESLDYALAPVDADINDFDRFEEIGIDYNVQDILDIIKDNGVLEGKVPYMKMETEQDQLRAAVAALDWAIDNRPDPELVAKYKREIRYLQRIAREKKREKHERA